MSAIIVVLMLVSLFMLGLMVVTIAAIVRTMQDDMGLDHDN